MVLINQLEDLDARLKNPKFGSRDELVEYEHQSKYIHWAAQKK